MDARVSRFLYDCCMSDFRFAIFHCYVEFCCALIVDLFVYDCGQYLADDVFLGNFQEI